MSHIPGHPRQIRPSADLVGNSRETGAASYPIAAPVGVVDDLADMLTIALSSLEQLRRQPLGQRGQQQLDWTEWAVRQAGRINQRMLAPARDESDDTGIVDLNEAVSAFALNLGQSVDESAALAVDLVPGPLPARLDGGMLELVLLSLARNAAAMAAGGQVTIRTAGHQVDGLGERPTVEVAVTSTAMSSEAVQRATDVFFAVQRPGRVTELSLRMVQRFAAGAGGKVEIETAAGRGTTVRLVVPRCETEHLIRS